MDPLRAARHLLAPDEYIVRVGVALVGGVGHRVEWTEPHRELVDDAEVLRDMAEIWPRYSQLGGRTHGSDDLVSLMISAIMYGAPGRTSRR